MIYVSDPFFISKFKSRLLSALGYLTNCTVYNYLILLSNTPALLRICRVRLQETPFLPVLVLPVSIFWQLYYEPPLNIIINVCSDYMFYNHSKYPFCI